MTDVIIRSGTSTKVTGTNLAATVAAGKSEVAARIATPAHVPGRAGQFEAFDLVASDGSIRTGVALDLGASAMAS